MGYQIRTFTLCLWIQLHLQLYQVNSFSHGINPSTFTKLKHRHRHTTTTTTTTLSLLSDDQNQHQHQHAEDEHFEKGDPDDAIEYGKFVVDDEGDHPLPPLPEFLKEESTPPPPPPPSTAAVAMDETTRRIEEQQKQIDMLMRTVNSRTATTTMPAEETLMELTEEAMEPLPPMEAAMEECAGSPVAPLRIMLFIDGTWLYYSIFERPAHLCPIVAKFGRGWQQNYNFNWGELPRIVCEALQEQELNTGWSNVDAVRPMEISRATVFTSVKKNTNVKSDRIQMFEDMKAANYDVYMMETVGSGEKCIDIQLAVEMLHYATVPNAYDVAILVSGDKDFMPALIRTRQKARKVGIVSKRPDCNRALYQTPNLIDYDVIWFEDYLDRLITVKKGVDIESITNAPDISRFTVIKVIFDFIDKSNLPMVSSRDVGRYLKRFQIGKSDIQTELKRQFRGLHQIVREAGVFSIQKVDSKMDKTFWISLTNNAEETLMVEARQARLTDIEKEFFDSYSLDHLDCPERAYEFSIQELSKIRPSAVSQFNDGGARNAVKTDIIQQQPYKQETKREYSMYTVVRLKEYCRDRGLAVSGVKLALIERLKEDDELQKQVSSPEVVVDIKRPTVDVPSSPTTDYLMCTIKEYIQASGGTAGSRDIGRYLNANSSYATREHGGLGNSTALSELKGLYGSLARFINTYEEIFDRTAAVDAQGNYEFQVSVK